MGKRILKKTNLKKEKSKHMSKIVKNKTMKKHKLSFQKKSTEKKNFCFRLKLLGVKEVLRKIKNERIIKTNEILGAELQINNTYMFPNRVLMINKKQDLLKELSNKYKSSFIDISIETTQENLFKKAKIEGPIFVDSTKFIKDILDFSFLSRSLTKLMPPKTGKSFNLHMLKTFLQMEFDEFGKKLKSNENADMNLFDKLRISKVNFYKKYQGSIPVVYLDFKKLKVDSLIALKISISTLIRDELRKYKFQNKKNSEHEHDLFDYYCWEDLNELEMGSSFSIQYQFSFLIEHLQKISESERIWILIDNIDHPYLEAFKNNLADFKFSAENSGSFNKDCFYLKIIKSLDYFIDFIIECHCFFLSIVITGTYNLHTNGSRGVYTYSTEDKKGGYLNKHYGLPYSYAEKILKKKFENLNLKKEETDKIEADSDKYLMHSFQPIAYKKDLIGFFYSDFIEFFKKLNDYKEENLSWFKKGHIIYDLVCIFIELNLQKFENFLYDCYKGRSLKGCKDIDDDFKLTEILEGNLNSFVKFLLLGGLITIHSDYKVQFINEYVRQEFANIVNKLTC